MIEESLSKLSSSLQKAAEWSQEAGMNRILTESLPMPPSLILITWCLSKRAHQFGAANWSKERKRAYANDLDDPETLIAVDLGLNRQKGAKDPAEWLSPNPAYQTEYVNAWVAVTLKYGCQSWQKNAEAPSTLSMPSYQSLK